MEVLFVTMPWATPRHPSLANGLFTATLETAGIPSSCLYGNLLLPRREGSVYEIDDPGYYEDRTAGLSFVPYVYNDVSPEQIAQSVSKRYLRLASREGQLDIDLTLSYGQDKEAMERAWVEETLVDVQAAGICLDRCVNTIALGNYDIVCFSLTFETQLAASLALAKRVKERWPHVKIVFGGAACVSTQGVTLLKAFDYLDVICLGEGDELIVPLVRALRNEIEVESIKGIAYRLGNRTFVNGKAPTLMNLDWLPIPNYDSFFEQKKNSEWADTSTVLLFEASRGCWWGEKHLCSFCGLNAETLTYRSKTAKRVMREIDAFCQRWDPEHGIQAVDNIFDMRYFEELVPLLIDYQRQRTIPLPIFFEIKSNLKYKHLCLLKSAGIFSLQPGIESFSDHILKLMDKGANAVQQISFIKWSNQVGVTSTYNILTRNPGETLEDYQEMTELLPYLKHLQPPLGIANMQLERYSPYFLRPETFGLKNIRPQPHYKEMFPDPQVDVDELVYQFDFDHDELDAPNLAAARKRFTLAVLDWKSNYREHQLEYYLRSDSVVILDRRNGDEQITELSGNAARIFLFLDKGQSFNAIAKEFTEIANLALRAYLEWLVSLRFVYSHHNDIFLAVPIRVFAAREFFAEMEREVQAASLKLQHRTQGRQLTVLPSQATAAGCP